MDILVYPRKKLIFEKTNQKSLFLTNNGSKTIVFLIKTTCPYAYTISPYLGTIKPKGEKVILMNIRNELKISSNPRLKIEFYDIPDISTLTEKDIKNVLKSKKYEPFDIKFLDLEFPNVSIHAEMHSIQNLFKSSPLFKSNNDESNNISDMNKSRNKERNVLEKIGVAIIFSIILIKMFFYYKFALKYYLCKFLILL